MDLSPGEKAVLAQIRVLYTEAPGEQLVRALTAQWLTAHYESYSTAYAGLIAKRFIQPINPQKFRLSPIGLRAIGVAAPTTTASSPRKVEQPSRARAKPKVQAEVRGARMSRFVGSLFGRRDA